MAKECDDKTIEANAKTATETRKDVLFGPVPVLITASDPAQKKISFRALSADEKSYVDVKDVDWEDKGLWTDCPSSLDADSKNQPAAQATGTLYISEAFAKANNVYARPKWPYALPTGSSSLTPIRIYPTSVKITGIELESGTMFESTIEALRPEFVGTAHTGCAPTITLDGSAITIEATAKGLAEFMLVPPDVKKLKDAVETIVAARDPLAISTAWRVVSRWTVDDTARNDSTASDLLARVLKS